VWLKEMSNYRVIKGREFSVNEPKVNKHMPIAITFAPSRSKKIAVDVVPANWQLYIAHD